MEIIDNYLSGATFCKHSKPQKLIVMLHGYGDNAENFINLASLIDNNSWKAKYLALNGPEPVPNYPTGNQWFNLYPNGIYITDAGIEEIQIIRKSILFSIEKIESTIIHNLKNLKLEIKDCILLGFSQGAMMVFELGKFLPKSFGGLAMLSGRIIEKQPIVNNFLIKTPIFISHGSMDEVLPIDNFYKSIKYFKKNNCNFESHELREDTHTISTKAINLLQIFIKKTMM